MRQQKLPPFKKRKRVSNVPTVAFLLDGKKQSVV
jgi:hypothetical protein